MENKKAPQTYSLKFSSWKLHLHSSTIISLPSKTKNAIEACPTRPHLLPKNKAVQFKMQALQTPTSPAFLFFKKKISPCSFFFFFLFHESPDFSLSKKSLAALFPSNIAESIGKIFLQEMVQRFQQSHHLNLD